MPKRENVAAGWKWGVHGGRSDLTDGVISKARHEDVELVKANNIWRGCQNKFSLAVACRMTNLHSNGLFFYVCVDLQAGPQHFSRGKKPKDRKYFVALVRLKDRI